MKCGIIGLPNVGKSTLFNCLTSLQIPAENYPFCTIDPNIGRVAVPDQRLSVLTEIFKPEKTTPTSMEFVDIAGLVPQAHKGEGLGNRFLSHIRETDALLHVVRCFEDEKISHTQGKLNPVRDVELIETELLMADLSTLEQRLQKLQKLLKGSKQKELLEENQLIDKLLNHLSEKGSPAHTCPVTREEKTYFKLLNLLTAKPVLYVCNTDEASLMADFKTSNPTSEKNNTSSAANRPKTLLSKNTPAPSNLLQKMKSKYPAFSLMPVCANMEAEALAFESKGERQSFLLSMGLKESGLSRLIKKSYQLLNLITFFTAGPKECRAWTIKKGTKAPQAGGLIHSDFEKGFIKAEVYAFEDLKKLKSEGAVRKAGLLRQEGKNYVIQNGDIVFFKFNI